MAYNIYTDGSTKGNGTNHSIGGYAVVVMDDMDLHVIDCYAQTNISNTTNNRMELTAILAAMVLYGRNRYPIKIFTDSNYAYGCLTIWWQDWAKNGWKRNNGQEIINIDLIKEFIDIAYNKKFRNPYKWDIFPVAGHSGILGNELADKLATGELTCEDVMNKYSLDRLGV